MTRFPDRLRAAENSWLAAVLGSVLLATGCGGTAPDPATRSSSAIPPADDESNDTTDERDTDEPTALAPDAGESGPRVVGYLPTYRLSESPPLHLETLTHLVVAFAVPNQQEKADFLDAPPRDIQQIVKQAHAAGVKVLVALGGGAGGGATSARLRNGVDSYVDSVVDLVTSYGFDGVDIDIEGDAIEPQTYEPLVLALAQRLRAFPERKLLSAAVAEYRRERYRALGAVDFLNVMSYDQCGSWSERACEHSTLAQADIDLAYWSAFTQGDETGTPRQIGAENVVLGVPFYGRCWGELCPDRTKKADGTYEVTTDLAYAQIAQYCADGTFSDCSASADVLTDGDEVHGYYVSLNSPSTIRAKAARSQSHGGIMIWELGQDASNAALFAEVANAFPKRRSDRD